MAGRRILIIVTNTSEMKDGEQTGLWLEEFAVPYLTFVSNGFQVAVASLRGGAAPIDPRSQPSPLKPEWAPAIAVLANTQVLSAVDTENFDAVYIPGGQGTMFDFPNHHDLQATLRSFARRQKVIAAMCHGPAGLVGVTLDDGTPLVAGKTLTGFTDAEENAAGFAHKMPFLLESKLKSLGAQFVAQPNWSDHVEVDGNLVTGQNPQSTLSAAQAVMRCLDNQ